MVFLLDPEYIRAISVRIMPGNFERTLDFIQDKWQSSFPGEEFEFSFLDNRVNQLYESEKKMQKIFCQYRCMAFGMVHDEQMATEFCIQS
jgi:putative ABC transport system permease protein